MAALAAVPALVAAQTAEDPSNVVLVFDVSNSILLSEDGTNVEFADALDDIADRVEANATELAIGNAEISFVVFGQTAITYRARCTQLALNEDAAAIQGLERCLRNVADEYRAGAGAPIRNRINTQFTDHVAALRAAADLLPDETTRSAVIFFTDGQHDPAGTARDDEDVVAEVAAAYEGRTPLAILPVGLGAGAGAFETELRAMYDAYFRDMEPCEGRAVFSWPTVVFPAAEDAGIAVAQALQEVTCSFNFAPPPTPTPTPVPTPTAPPTPSAPLGVQLLAGDGALTVLWLAPTEGAAGITAYRVTCTPEGGSPIETEVAATGALEAELSGLAAGTRISCVVTALAGDIEGAASETSETVVVLGIPAAPGQPRIELLDNAARVIVDPVAGGAPAEDYVFECRDTAGAVAGNTISQQPSAVVAGLANGQTFDCVAYAQNRIGKSEASAASARFSPCGGFLDCNPWAKFVLIGGVVAAALVLGLYAFNRYRRRNRVWITAQVDGGANTPLGWGPEIGIQLEQGDAGWFAALRPAEGSDITARYRGDERFVVTSKAGIRDVHQGDPAPVRDETGGLHELILRRYRQRPKERVLAPPAPKDVAPGDDLGERLEGKEREAPPESDLVG
jgi:hypothetical protein